MRIDGRFGLVPNIRRNLQGSRPPNNYKRGPLAAVEWGPKALGDKGEHGKSCDAPIGAAELERGETNEFKQELREELEAAGLLEKVGEDRIFMTLPTAVEAYRNRRKPLGRRADQHHARSHEHRGQRQGECQQQAACKADRRDHPRAERPC